MATVLFNALNSRRENKKNIDKKLVDKNVVNKKKNITTNKKFSDNKSKNGKKIVRKRINKYNPDIYKEIEAKHE